jgi:hypothetical protein
MPLIAILAAFRRPYRTCITCVHCALPRAALLASPCQQPYWWCSQESLIGLPIRALGSWRSKSHHIDASPWLRGGYSPEPLRTRRAFDLSESLKDPWLPRQKQANNGLTDGQDEDGDIPMAQMNSSADSPRERDVFEDDGFDDKAPPAPLQGTPAPVVPRPRYCPSPHWSRPAKRLSVPTLVPPGQTLSCATPELSQVGRG